MIAVAIGGTVGRLHVLVPDSLRTLAFVFLGITMGSGATTDFLHAIATWPVSLIGLMLTSLLITIVVSWVLMQGFKWERETAVYASVPGVLSVVMTIAAERQADVTRIAIVQVMRVYVLILAAPLAVTMLNGDGGRRGELAYTIASVPELLVLSAACALGGYLADRVKFPAGWLFGSFLVSLVAHIVGWVEGGFPPEILIPGYIVMSAFIGARINLISREAVLQVVIASVVSLLIGTGIAIAMALAVAGITGLPADHLLLSYAPGALEVMVVLSFLLGLDTTFVAVHQLARFSFMALFLPFFPLLLRRLGGGSP